MAALKKNVSRIGADSFGLLRTGSEGEPGEFFTLDYSGLLWITLDCSGLLWIASLWCGWLLRRGQEGAVLFGSIWFDLL